MLKSISEMREAQILNKICFYPNTGEIKMFENFG